ncbi:MAG: UDP-N-acetylmuramoylalanine--D-glutamate ligase 2 [Microgenomates group bacterium Gr01-1014_93]|nr:MAG: UDP-N-acetylmuramoylalanine--D-glutamate ligase 2 [Microgenomates group bacterium Gr01-1014_93]
MNLNSFESKKILILGLGKEGISTLKFLRRNFPNKVLSVADKKELNEIDQKELISKDKNLNLHFGNKYLEQLDEFDLVFKSPGIKIATSENITSQTEFFLENFRDKVIGITGTKGKSTTSSLLYKIIKDAGFKTALVGNIGNPPFDIMSKNSMYDFFVFELSSFQLENLKLSPHIAVILNLYQEHLDVHKSFEQYKKAKSNIAKFQTKKDFLIFNAENENVKKMVQASDAIKIPYSNIKKLDVGMYIDNDWLFYENEKVVNVKQTNLRGEFNLNNILPAVVAAKILKISNNSIASSLKSFNPLPHRLEYIGKVRGVDYFNDSIATIPKATIAALETLGSKVQTLILGGFDRGLDYSNLAKVIVDKKIENLILFPETGKQVGDEIDKINIYIPNEINLENMPEAVKKAAEITESGRICLLSPAASSFNLFRDYQDRGNQFKEEVLKLK